MPALYDGGLTEVEGELHGAARQLLLEVEVRLRERWAQRASQIPDVLFRNVRPYSSEARMQILNFKEA